MFVNLQPTFEEALVVDTVTKTLVPIIDVDKDANEDDDADDDAHDYLDYVSNADGVPEPATIGAAPICDIVLYPETKSAVVASPLLRRDRTPSPHLARTTSNTTKYQKKTKKSCLF